LIFCTFPTLQAILSPLSVDAVDGAHLCGINVPWGGYGISRAKLLGFFASLPPYLVGIGMSDRILCRKTAAGEEVE
jgi:hypothetical protein